MLVRGVTELADGGASGLIDGEPGISKSSFGRAAISENAAMGCEVSW